MRDLRKIFLLSICLTSFMLTGCQKQDSSLEDAEVNSEIVEENTERVESVPEETDNIGNKNTSEIETEKGETENMKIQIEANGNKIIFELNDSQAAKDLYAQLPLTTENEDFSNNEKTFYPPKKLDVTGAPHTDGSVGTLAYYEPWGDVVIFYGAYNPNDALYELGKASSGSEYMEAITGEMTISATEE